jgi:hypothetical protein
LLEAGGQWLGCSSTVWVWVELQESVLGSAEGFRQLASNVGTYTTPKFLSPTSTSLSPTTSGSILLLPNGCAAYLTILGVNAPRLGFIFLVIGMALPEFPTSFLQKQQAPTPAPQLVGTLGHPHTHIIPTICVLNALAPEQRADAVTDRGCWVIAPWIGGGHVLARGRAGQGRSLRA